MDMVKNPELNRMAMQFEMTIHTVDVLVCEAREKEGGDFELTDSVVKSALRRAMGYVKGRPPKAVKGVKERDVWLRNLTENLWTSCQQAMGEFTRGEILKCLEAIEDSLKIRTVGDARGYLDYLIEFFGEMGVEAREISEEETKGLN